MVRLRIDRASHVSLDASADRKPLAGCPSHNDTCRAHAVHPVSDLQIEYSLLSRGTETEILPTIRQCRRGHEEGDPAVRQDHPTRRGNEDPVDGAQLEWAPRPLQHPELMAQNEDLEVPGSVGSIRLSSAEEETDEGADDEIARIGVSNPHGRNEIQSRMCCNSALGSRSAPFPTKQTWPPTLTPTFEVPETTA